jgi:phosphoribosylaminoimidazole carboxylase (NCAIR synthetase)
MPSVIFVVPFFDDRATRYIDALVNLPDVRLGVVSQDPFEHLTEVLRGRVAAHWRIDDVQNSGQLLWAAQALARQLGAIHRLLSMNEQLQVPVAEAREQLGIEGMRVEVALNFRDKARMKTMLRAAGLPCARHRVMTSAADAWQFANEVGYPLVLKPQAGAGAQSTFQIDNPAALEQALRELAPHSNQPVQMEEFIVGDEHSLETVSLDGKAIWHSLTHYLPSILDVVRHPWIQWGQLLPREIDDPHYDDIRQVGSQALQALGMGTGLSHLEWFRRRDGSVVISEVAARPPGAQMMTLTSRAHDVDLYSAWGRLMIFGVFDPPPRRFAAGTAFLRGMGRGRVKAVHGLDQAQRELGHLVTDVKLPQVGQPSSTSYEGEGYVILRHPETAVVEQALRRLVSLVRVELSEG